MASKNPSTNPRRFRVETIGHELVIFDTSTITYKTCPSGTSRSDAEHQCAVLNGTSNPRRPTAAPTLHREFNAHGITPERLGAWMDEFDLEWGPLLPPLDHCIDYRAWLPPALRRWADLAAERHGYGGERHGTWRTWDIVKTLRRPDFWPADPEAPGFLILPSTNCEPFCTPEEAELREALALHYLSSDPARLKAGHLGMSRASFLRAVDGGHRLVARRWLP